MLAQYYDGSLVGSRVEHGGVWWQRIHDAAPVDIKPLIQDWINWPCAFAMTVTESWKLHNADLIALAVRW